MKFKKLLGGGLLAAVLALGVGAGLAVRSESNEADAATDTRIYCAIDSATLGTKTMKFNAKYGTGGSDPWTGELPMTLLSDTYESMSVFSIDFTDKWDGLATIQFQLYEGSSQAGIDEVMSNIWTPVSTYNNKLWVYKGSDRTWKEFTPDVKEYTVTLNAVDFVAGSAGTPYDIGSKKVVENTVYTPDAPETKNMYHFDGWFTDSNCTTKYVPHAITQNETLYAKRIQMTLDSYVFWIDKNSSALVDGRVYFFGEYENSWEEGPLLSSYEVSGGAFNFNNDGHLYKIPVPSIGDFQMILHNGSTQTEDMIVTQKNVYYTWEGDYKYSYSSVGGAIAMAAEFVSDAEDLRNAATYKTLNYSVCGISKTDAAKLIDRYDNVLDDEARGYVNASFTNTYDPSKSASESPSEVQVQYSLIIAKLREIADGTEPNLNTRSISLFGDIDNSTPIMLVVIISVVSLTAVGGYTFLKRRKEN